MQRFKSVFPKRMGFLTLLSLSVAFSGLQLSSAQTVTRINDLSAFKDPGKTWKIAGAVRANLDEPNVLVTSAGSGVIVNLPDKKTHGVDLFTREAFGDMDLELDYMMARESNSGIYLQGRYEVQLHDSWTVKNPSSGNNGGIYERWDDSRPKGQNGYEGHAPRQNASRAPGLWQHLKISFQAPRFDASGKKTQNARVLRAELNGVLIHEDVELSGSTRGSAGPEAATGPLRFQGDHGAVAFRNITVTRFDSGRGETQQEKPYRVYPISVTTADHPVFRSFMDLPGGTRVVHAVSASSDQNVHYTYDTDKGSIIQVWRGQFLDATPMWYSRGDGSSRPFGAVLTFGDPVLSVRKLASAQSPWASDTAGTGFRPRGYVLEKDETPVFRYTVFGADVTDASDALPGGEGINRKITLTAPAQNMYVRLAENEKIEEIGKGLYLIGDNAYYIRIEGNTKPVIRNGASGRKEMIAPIANTLTYSLLF